MAPQHAGRTGAPFKHRGLKDGPIPPRADFGGGHCGWGSRGRAAHLYHGWMQTRATLAAVGAISISILALAAKGAEPGLALAGPVPAGLGVNIHFTDPRPGEMEMLAAAGFTFVRMDFGWAATERAPGQYDFSAYERLLAALDKHHVRALFILDYSNRLYDDGLSPHTDEGRAAFARWAAAAATHFNGRGVIWEVWNEPNIKQFWKPQPSAEDYAKLA